MQEKQLIVVLLLHVGEAPCQIFLQTIFSLRFVFVCVFFFFKFSFHFFFFIKLRFLSCLFILSRQAFLLFVQQRRQWEGRKKSKTTKRRLMFFSLASKRLSLWKRIDAVASQATVYVRKCKRCLRTVDNVYVHKLWNNALDIVRLLTLKVTI